ncbi:MAG: hypothetical protein JWM11_2374, partial [Planctomycetaceae bacterium]|nr:hypothetical protein [Planctomycetaceae bacterium]
MIMKMTQVLESTSSLSAFWIYLNWVVSANQTRSGMILSNDSLLWNVGKH